MKFYFTENYIKWNITNSNKVKLETCIPDFDVAELTTFCKVSCIEIKAPV